jgi:DmsE family decaheme c-type cytochrome
VKIIRRFKSPAQFSSLGLVVLGILALGIASCTAPYRPTRRTETNLDPGWPRGNDFFSQASYSRLQVPAPTIPGAEYVNDDELCLTCHEAYAKAFENNVHRGLRDGQPCEACHGPASRHLETRGKEPGLILNFKTLPAAEKSEICLKCHEENRCAPGARWRTSVHAHCGVACTDCHRSHYNVPEGTSATTEPGATAAGPSSPLATLVRNQQPPQKPAEQKPSLAGSSNHMGAVAPDVCYKCHGDMYEFEEIAGPHQILGPNGFNCTTCHDPHGKILERGRKELCLECHGCETPTMAFHSSTHDLEGVACTDCHNPHPRTKVPRVVGIDHWQVKRPKRLPMCVDQPEACYKCHPKIFGLNALPSHHPIKEGKMVCTDCHDAHGQAEDNLKEVSVNLVCYKCHADRQGPFAYEHPPVTENCTYCHEPHGTVAENLLRQPSPFLCLRCHSGHRGGPSFHDTGLLRDFVADTGSPFAYGPTQRPQVQASFYTDCTQCHSQIHGSDLPTPHRPGVFFR